MCSAPLAAIQSSKVRLGLGRDDAQPGARLAEQPRLGERLVAVADDDHGFALDPHENGEGVEPGSVLWSSSEFRQASLLFYRASD